jgi:hypothetical protein
MASCEQPDANRGPAPGLLIFVPSYFDFVRLRNALKADELGSDLAAVSEYSGDAEVGSRARGFGGH